MADLLTLSRAARLVGITRGELQQRIRRDELRTFEGKVAVSDLMRAFPETRLEDDSTLERVNRIKAAATPDKEPKYELPTPEVLAERVNILSQELTDAKARLSDYAELVDALSHRLAGLGEAGEVQLRREAAELHAWLQQQARGRPREPRRDSALLAKDTFLRMLAAQVQVVPSGHEFFVEGAMSILDAGLRAGLALKYGCASGTCGACKARLVTGRVLQVRDHEYVISDKEKDRGYILMCSCTAVTDVMIEAAEAKGSDDIPDQAFDARVRRLDRLGADVMVLHVQTPSTQRLRFLSGQSASVKLPSHTREDMPLACCPCDSQNLEFHVHRGADTPFVREVFGGALKPGDTVHVEGPAGVSFQERSEGGPMLLIAQEEGFSALKGFIENAISVDDVEGFHLIWATARDEGRYLDNLCRAWADALENFTYQPLLLPAAAGTEKAATALDEALDRVADVSRCQVYVSGSDEFNAAVETRLERLSVPRSRLQITAV